MKRILVTGSSGSIGTRTVETLLAAGYDVIGVDKDPNVWSTEVDARTIIADLTDRSQVATLPHDVDCIVHLAAYARISDLIENPLLARDNVEMTINMWEFARVHGITKTILASSREVYGSQERDVWDETCIDVDGCGSPYSMSKLASEAIVRSYQQCYNIDTIVLRFSNNYGMYDTHNRIVPIIIARTLTGSDLHVFGAEKTLDFTYIDDTVSGIVLALEHFAVAKNHAYNIGAGVGTRIVDLISLVHSTLEKTVPVHIKDNRVGDMMKFYANIDKAKRVLGYAPTVPLRDGIARTVQWYKNFFTQHPERLSL